MLCIIITDFRSDKSSMLWAMYGLNIDANLNYLSLFINKSCLILFQPQKIPFIDLFGFTELIFYFTLLQSNCFALKLVILYSNMTFPLKKSIYCSFKSKKKLAHVIRLSPINSGYIQIINKMLWQQ